MNEFYRLFDTKAGRTVKFVLISILVYLGVGIYWVGLEYILDGVVIPQQSDEIMGIILSVLITKNILSAGEDK